MSFSEIIEQQPPSICLLCSGHHKEEECEDPHLRDFEVFCATIYHTMCCDKDELDYLLAGFYIYGDYYFGILLYCFAIKYMHCTRDSCVFDCIESIVHYISDKYTLGHQDGIRTVWSYEGTLDPDNLCRMCEEYYLIIADNSTIFTDPYADTRPNSHLWQSIQTNQNPYLSSLHIRPTPMQTFTRQQIDLVTELRFHSEEEYAVLHDCCICWEKKELREFVNYRCKHEFCKECVLGTLTHKQPGELFTCALCRQPVDFITFHSEETRDALDAFLV